MRNFIFLLLLSTAAAQAATEPAPQPESNVVSNAEVKVAVLPTYPRGARKRGIDGDVTVSFTISRYGRAIDAAIVNETPDDTFRDVVLDALKYWAFVPARPVACGTVPQTAEQTFRFRHSQEPAVEVLPIVIGGVPTLPREQQRSNPELLRINELAARGFSPVSDPRALVPVKRVEASYPEKAMERRREGVVAISFLIEKDGSTSNAVVVDSVNGALFKGAALRALAQWQFEPTIRDGEAVERMGCHEFVFNVDEYLLEQQRREHREREGVDLVPIGN